MNVTKVKNCYLHMSHGHGTHHSTIYHQRPDFQQVLQVMLELSAPSSNHICNEQSCSFTASVSHAGSLPGVAAGQEALVSIILVGLAILALLLGYRHSALLFLNLAIALFTYVRTAEGTIRSSQLHKSQDSPRNDDLPDWEVVLVKAEVVRDEHFQGDHRLSIYPANTSIVNQPM